MYSLRRTRDGAGDSGPMSTIIGTKARVEQCARPKVGYCVMVGSIIGRTFAAQDYWLTTPVTEITLDTPNEVHFKTGNSEYVWEEF